MSVTLGLNSTPDQVFKHQTNDSQSKALYSFPKARRFGRLKQALNHSIYQMPSSLSKRGTSFGYGKNIDYDDSGTRKENPPPTKYDIRNNILNEKKGCGFGTGREETKFLNMFYNNAKDQPGPGKYHIPLLKTPVYSSLKGRKLKVVKDPSPGPGHYQIKPILNKKGNYFNSRFKSSGASKFNRRETLRSKKMKPSEIPGPGHYSIKLGRTSGKYIQSRHRNNRNVNLKSTAKRDFIRSQSHTPGPGSYFFPSDFGFYKAINKKVRGFSLSRSRSKKSRASRSNKLLNKTMD